MMNYLFLFIKFYAIAAGKKNRPAAVVRVRVVGFEPTTPSVSVMCSTN